MSVSLGKKPLDRGRWREERDRGTGRGETQRGWEGGRDAVPVIMTTNHKMQPRMRSRSASRVRFQESAFRPTEARQKGRENAWKKERESLDVA